MPMQYSKVGLNVPRQIKKRHTAKKGKKVDIMTVALILLLIIVIVVFLLR
jgi:hypothetical protein